MRILITFCLLCLVVAASAQTIDTSRVIGVINTTPSLHRSNGNNPHKYKMENLTPGATYAKVFALTGVCGTRYVKEYSADNRLVAEGYARREPFIVKLLFVHFEITHKGLVRDPGWVYYN